MPERRNRSLTWPERQTAGSVGVCSPPGGLSAPPPLWTPAWSYQTGGEERRGHSIQIPFICHKSWLVQGELKCFSFPKKDYTQSLCLRQKHVLKENNKRNLFTIYIKVNSENYFNPTWCHLSSKTLSSKIPLKGNLGHFCEQARAKFWINSNITLMAGL